MIFNKFLFTDYSTRRRTFSVRSFWLCSLAAWVLWQILCFYSIWWVRLIFWNTSELNSSQTLQALHGNFLDMGISVYALCSTGCILFLYCYSGERTTQNYLSFDQLIFDSKWHRLPIYLQKELIMIIAAAQRPSEYHGSGLAFLNLNTFCRVNI